MNTEKIKIGLYALAWVVFAVVFMAMSHSEKEENLSTYSNNIMEPQPEELGKVHWLRNINEAIGLSEKKQKPILILFQEVPGCLTCRNYGNFILSHPLIVEAIETSFIPLAIYNNKGGEDEKVLSYFGEPSWNNPVVRIVDSNKKDISQRLGGNYTAYGLVSTMINALDLNGDVVPNYLYLLAEELLAETTGTEKATVAMYCFWTGEKEIGKLDGVVSTQPGFMGGREVVEVEYNPEVISYKDLLEGAQKAQCASHVYAENGAQNKIADGVVGSGRTSEAGKFKLDREPKYYLSKTHYQYVPMTPFQAVKVNSLIGQRKSPEAILSPRQQELAAFISKNTDLAWESAINVPIEKAWGSVEKVKQ